MKKKKLIRLKYVKSRNNGHVWVEKKYSRSFIIAKDEIKYRRMAVENMINDCFFSEFGTVMMKYYLIHKILKIEDE